MPIVDPCTPCYLKFAIPNANYVQLKTWTHQCGYKNLDRYYFCQKIGKSRSCKKNNSGILDFVEKKIMRVFKCDVMYIEEIKLFLDTKPFFILIM